MCNLFYTQYIAELRISTSSKIKLRILLLPLLFVCIIDAAISIAIIRIIRIIDIDIPMIAIARSILMFLLLFLLVFSTYSAFEFSNTSPSSLNSDRVVANDVPASLSANICF